MRSAGSPSKRKWNGNCPDKLIEPVGDDEAATLLECGAEGRFFGHGLGPGVDQSVADGRVVGPGRDEPPLEEREPALAARRVEPHDGHRLRRGDVVAGQEQRDVGEVEGLDDGLSRGFEGVAATHGLFSWSKGRTRPSTALEWARAASQSGRAWVVWFRWQSTSEHQRVPP